MAAQCFVSFRDYGRYWTATTPTADGPPAWDGSERRVQRDRRLGLHDRRWDAVPGRRHRVGDRRTRRASTAQPGRKS